MPSGSAIFFELGLAGRAKWLPVCFSLVCLGFAYSLLVSAQEEADIPNDRTLGKSKLGVEVPRSSTN